MSDAARQNLKVSREGIVLIKSFEGFRPRAIQRVEGGWIIGYGHTRSAREGGTVSEADAELLLRYDLMPVERSINEAIPATLNQHQFDALVSFAFSVGIEDFVASDVRQRLTAGAPGEAADALMGWPEPVLPQTTLRRRGAERALFVANPSAPVALADLLAAPLPSPPVPAPVAVPAEELQGEPIIEAEPASAPEAGSVGPTDPGDVAVALLVGEPPLSLVQDQAVEPLIPTFAVAAAGPESVAPTPSEDTPSIADGSSEDIAPEPAPGSVPNMAEEAASASEAASGSPVEHITTDLLAVEGLATPIAPIGTVGPTTIEASVWSAVRYAPYSLAMVGPLPYLQPAISKDGAALFSPSIDYSVAGAAVSRKAPALGSDEAGTSDLSAGATPIAGADRTDGDTASASAAASPQIEPATHIPPVAIAHSAELILTPLEDAPEPAVTRPLWTAEQRTKPDGSENNLFGEDLILTQGGGAILRHESEIQAPARFDWSATGPFIFMGGIGLVSFGAAMAAFRRAAEQSGGSDLTNIGWVLALIGLACVGVSSINLYRKFGLRSGH